jgi:hypothetical protein
MGTPSLLYHQTASPVTDFPGEPHPPSPYPTCSPLLTRVHAAPAAAPRRPVHHCELRHHAGRGCGDCARRAHRSPTRGQLGQLGWLCGPHARPVADVAGHGKRASTLRGHGPEAEYRPRLFTIY